MNYKTVYITHIETPKKIGARPDFKSQHRKPSDELQAIAVRSSCTVMLLISVALVDLQQLSDFVVESESLLKLCLGARTHASTLPKDLSSQMAKENYRLSVFVSLKYCILSFSYKV